MRRRLDTHNNFGLIWTAETINFRIELRSAKSYEKYDGDDDGSTQAAIDAGEMVYFDTELKVFLKGTDDEIAWDNLGSSCYFSGRVHEFIRDGYFKDMLSNVCNAARVHVANIPKLRVLPPPTRRCTY